ncbi:MAG TPA: 50S ribosomal protein L29 [candidate division Zixibacteria bacterium]|nr:50S ribosomal protein L29 [candidate division Zixibacteria bacterium]HBZ01598.1 50S ribosomal protein L29 [candidate division Zixibacteria bacterium]
MKPREIRDLTKDEILVRKEELEREVFNLKIRQATKQIDNPLRIRVLRRELARITTILAEDESNVRKLASKGEINNA